MTPQEFVAKWSDSRLRESQASQEHFIDLCAMLGEATPATADPTGEWYAFEKGALKTGGGDGWADVWKRGCFALEYKGRGKDLGAALKQLKMYASALENPPLLIVSDMERIEFHTNWTNRVQETHVLTLDDLLDARLRQKLKWAFSAAEVEQLRPERKRSDLTREVAEEFVFLAQNLRDRGHEPERVAHFVNRMVFCMFAEDVDLLPDKMFTRLLELSAKRPDRFVENAKRLFGQMKTGGVFDMTDIEWFNGGLFNDDDALPLQPADMKIALKAARQDWSNVDPAIMGTLFERGLDPAKRSQLGAHYTDPDKIMLIVNPVIVEPLSRDWEAAKAEIAAKFEQSKTAKSPGARTKAVKQARALKSAFIERLKEFRVLDPACGSGNFLYLSLKALKDLEHRVNTECENLGLPRGFPVVGPENVKGIEINPFAAELARVSVWVGEIQWMREHGFDASRNPILRPLETIICHDALLNDDGSEYAWPAATVIVGNPPFLGGKLLRGTIGDSDVDRMFAAFDGRVPAEADLVCYWFTKAREQIGAHRAERAGLVTTNSIRGGANREVLDDIEESGRIFNAWSDEPWVLDGAAVRVSLVCFQNGMEEMPALLDGTNVERINTDLTSSATDLTKVDRLKDNASVAFMGDTKGGAFDVSGDVARQWLQEPLNPNGRPNSDVLKPWVNGMDITRRPSGKWIIDFGWTMKEREAALYEKPFAFAEQHIKPVRIHNNREAYAKNWWRHVEPRQGLMAKSSQLTRWIVTPEVSRHRVFRWLDRRVVPDHKLQVITRDDETTFGVLVSRIHNQWALGVGSWHGVGNDPRYTISTCFETFPFPEGLTPNIRATDYAADPRAVAIAIAAAELDRLREAWLNPPDLVQRLPEVVPGYPDRILPVDAKAAAIIKKRTLTNLYNERPAWLANAHADLDRAVAAAYGWPADLGDEQILERLFALNQERAKAGR